MRQHSTRASSAAICLAGLFLVAATAAPCRAAGPAAESDAYRVELAASRDVAFTGVRGVTVKEHVLEVTDKAAGETRTLVFGGPDKPVSGELESVRLRDGRLVATTASAVGVFDLATGRELHLARGDDPAVSDSGRWVAYKAFQPRFLPPEATAHVVLVLDVDALESAPVYPEPEKVAPGSRGELLAWEEDPEKRLRVGQLFWGPGEETLLFFGKRWPTAEAEALQTVDSFVLVDLRRGPGEASFVERRIEPETYMKPSAEVGGSRMLFNVARVEWRDGEAFTIVPPDGYWWMKERITIEVPPVPGPGARNG